MGMPQTHDQFYFFIGGLNYWKTPQKFVFNQMFGDKFPFECKWVVEYVGHRSFLVFKGCLVINKHLVMGCSTLLF